MIIDGLRGYIQLANGLTDVTRERARAAAKALVSQGEAGVDAVVPSTVRTQVSALTDDLIATSKVNRTLLVSLVRGEVERSVARLGLVASTEVDAANRRARALERRVDELEQELARSRSAAARRPAKKSTAKKATAKKATAKKATAKRATARRAASSSGPA